MKPMPNQNPLPFPGEEPPKTPDAPSASPDTAPDPAAGPAPVPSTAAEAPPVSGQAVDSAPANAGPAAAAPAAIVPGLRAPVGRRPWWARLLGRLVEPWLSLKIEPEHPGQYNDGRPVVYVLEDYGLSNALILDKACREAGLPSPLVPIAGDPTGRKRAYLALSRRSSSNSLIPEQRGAKTHSDSLAKLLQAHRANPALDIHLVPVSIFVGRAPDKQSGWFAVLFSENWALVGRFRRLLAVLLNGRDTIVRFAPPVSLRETVDEGLEPERTVRSASRPSATMPRISTGAAKRTRVSRPLSRIASRRRKRPTRAQFSENSTENQPLFLSGARPTKIDTGTSCTSSAGSRRWASISRASESEWLFFGAGLRLVARLAAMASALPTLRRESAT